MNNRKEILDLAINRMAGFRLEGSSMGDNRSIFSLIKTLLMSAPGDSLEDCRKPLAAVLKIKIRNSRERFHGSKLTLLNQTIKAMFGDIALLLSSKYFMGYDRHMLLTYLELCRRIYTAQYSVNYAGRNASSEINISQETDIQRALRLATQRKSLKGKNN